MQLSREQKYVTLFLSRTFCSSSSTAGRAALYADFTRAAAAEAEEKPTRFSAAVHWITLNSSHISEMITIAGMSYSQICAGSSSGLEVGSRYKAETPPLQREISIRSYFLIPNDTLGRDNWKLREEISSAGCCSKQSTLSTLLAGVLSRAHYPLCWPAVSELCQSLLLLQTHPCSTPRC